MAKAAFAMQSLWHRASHWCLRQDGSMGFSADRLKSLHTACTLLKACIASESIPVRADIFACNAQRLSCSNTCRNM